MSIISASTTTTTAFGVTTDTTGTLVFKTGATPTTALTIDASQNITFANQPTYTGGIANGVAYLNGSKVLTTGSALVFDGSNLGVGTSSPAAKLNISGTTSGNSILLNGSGTGANFARFTSTGGDGVIGLEASASTIVVGSSPYATVLYTVGSTPLQFGTNSNIRATIDTSGNLGLGVTPSAWGAGQRAIQSGNFTASGGGNGFTSNGYYNAGWKYVANGYATNIYEQSGAIKFDIAASGTAGNTISFTQAMTLDASGNLLVGTISNNGTGRLNALASSNANPAIVSGSGSTGDVGTAVHLFYKFDNNSTTSQVFCRFAINNNGATSGQINANGANAAAFGSWSDSRLKENIVNLPSQLSNIMALRPVEFDYIESEGGGHQIGFIAQEMQEIYPDAVGVRQPDEMLTVTGWSKTEARLVKAIQEQQAIIEQLRADVETLKGAA